MKTRMTIIMLGAVLLFAGIADAQQQPQVPLPAATIPQFVEPLPLLEFEFINATSVTLPGVLAPLGARTERCDLSGQCGGIPVADPAIGYAAWPAAACRPAGRIRRARPGDTCPIPTIIQAGIRPTYLGPVVIAETGVAANPVYGNNLPCRWESCRRTCPSTDARLGRPIRNDWTCWLSTGSTNRHLIPTRCAALCPDVGPIPIATHLHGGEVAPAYDGGPDAWFTQGNADNRRRLSWRDSTIIPTTSRRARSGSMTMPWALRG